MIPLPEDFARSASPTGTNNEEKMPDMRYRWEPSLIE
jgi:hypothetical protein